MPGPAGRFEWERLIRRARLESTEKLIALLLATYADADGSRVHPGIQRLANVSGKSSRTVIRAIAVLQEKGFLECTFDGSRSGRRGMADEYRLLFPADESVLVLNPDELPGDTHVTWLEPSYPQPGDTHDTWSDGDHVTNQADQVTPVTEPGDTHDTPPQQHQSIHQPPEATVITPTVEVSATCGQPEPDFAISNGHKKAPHSIAAWKSKGRHARTETTT